MKHRDITKAYGYRRRFVFAFYDMIFTDVLLLFMRVLGFIWLALEFPGQILFIYPLVTLFYFASEAMAIVTAAVVSSNKSDLKNIWLVPIVVLFYRPVYSYLRLIAYLKGLFKLEIGW
jgi:lysylphosphatidylglycerol synthetase-like protein (DUF2156 family)